MVMDDVGEVVWLVVALVVRDVDTVVVALEVCDVVGVVVCVDVIVVVLEVVGVVMRQSANRPFWYAWMALFSDVAAAEHPVAS